MKYVAEVLRHTSIKVTKETVTANGLGAVIAITAVAVLVGLGLL